jgi:hypothetical protein
MSYVPGDAAGGSEIRALGPLPGLGVMDVKPLEIPRVENSAPAPAVHLDLFCSASHSIEPMVYMIWVGSFLGLLRAPTTQFKAAPALHVRIKHFQGSAAAIDLVVMSEIREAFEDADQVLVPAATLDLDVAGAALRTEGPKPCQLVAPFDAGVTVKPLKARTR